MNHQLKTRAGQLIGRGIEWVGTALDAPLPGVKTMPYRLPDGRMTYLMDNGRTSNPIAGCHFGCRWTMPDGSEAICYAERVAEGVARGAFEDGFAPVKFTHGHAERQVYWRPEELTEWGKSAESEIFVGSMADVFGPWVPDELVQKVIERMRGAFWHRYYLLTKNAPRLVHFDFPENAWVGASVPPSRMNGTALDDAAQRRMLLKTVESLRETRSAVRWLSLEPLSWDAADVLSQVPYLAEAIQWMVIGAATNGAKAYQPEPRWVNRLLILADEQQIPVFFKGNLEWDRSRWREDKPVDRFLRNVLAVGALDPSARERRAGPPKPRQLDMFGGAT